MADKAMLDNLTKLASRFRLLIGSLEELVREMPEIEEWGLPSVRGATLQ